MTKKEIKLSIERRSKKIEILEKLAVKLRENDLCEEAEKIERSISALNRINKYESKMNPQKELEEAKAYLSSVSTFIRENSRIDEEVLKSRFI